MSGNTINALNFLIGKAFEFYVLILIIRLVLAWAGADNYHPVTRFVVNATSFFIKPLKKILPDFHGVEISTLVAIILVEFIKYLILTLLSYGMPNLLGTLIQAFADSLRLMLEALSIALFIQLVLGWLQPGSSVHQILTKFTSPIMRPIQRIIPPIGGVDISPIPVIIILQLLVIVIVNPLAALGLAMAIGA